MRDMGQWGELGGTMITQERRGRAQNPCRSHLVFFIGSIVTHFPPPPAHRGNLPNYWDGIMQFRISERGQCLKRMAIKSSLASIVPMSSLESHECGQLDLASLGTEVDLALLSLDIALHKLLLTIDGGCRGRR